MYIYTYTYMYMYIHIYKYIYIYRMGQCLERKTRVLDSHGGEREELEGLEGQSPSFRRKESVFVVWSIFPH